MAVSLSHVMCLLVNAGRVSPGRPAREHHPAPGVRARACARACVRVLPCARTIACYLSFVCACVRACVRAVSDTASPVRSVPRMQERIWISPASFWLLVPPTPPAKDAHERVRVVVPRLSAARKVQLAWDFCGRSLRPDELDEVVEAAAQEAAARSAQSCTHAHSSGGAACRGNLNGKRARHSPESPCPCGLRC